MQRPNPASCHCDRHLYLLPARATCDGREYELYTGDSGGLVFSYLGRLVYDGEEVYGAEG